MSQEDSIHDLWLRYRCMVQYTNTSTLQYKANPTPCNLDAVTQADGIAEQAFVDLVRKIIRTEIKV